MLIVHASHLESLARSYNGLQPVVQPGLRPSSVVLGGANATLECEDKGTEPMSWHKMMITKVVSTASENGKCGCWVALLGIL